MRTKTRGKIAGYGCAILLLLVACQPDQIDIQEKFEGFVVPSHFPPAHYNNPENPVTKNGFELGRRLFYDPILSSDSTISCGSCHAQVHAFADHNNRFSTGIAGQKGDRNSPALSNLAWYKHFMWDGGINNLEIMPFAPITDHREMNEDLSNVVSKLKNQPSYVLDFEKAFGKNALTDQKMFYALAQFMRMMVSANSKYDQYVLGKSQFTEQEKEGLALFRQHCESCHKEPLFTDFSFANNGLDFVYADAGRGKLTQLPADSGAFAVPNLRNVALTYPYMHDGRFFTLADVLQHYAAGVKPNGKLDARLLKPLPLNAQQQDAIIAFLGTLTDYDFLTNRALAEPRK